MAKKCKACNVKLIGTSSYWYRSLFTEININICSDVQVKYRSSLSASPNSYCDCGHGSPTEFRGCTNMTTIPTLFADLRVSIPLFSVAVGFLPFCLPMCLSEGYTHSSFPHNYPLNYLHIWLPTWHVHTHRVIHNRSAVHRGRIQKVIIGTKCKYNIGHISNRRGGTDL